jgi:hypothetical protein
MFRLELKLYILIYYIVVIILTEIQLIKSKYRKLYVRITIYMQMLS